MEFIAAKLSGLFLQPLGAAILLLTVALFLGWRRFYRTAFFISAVVLGALWAMSMPITANTMAERLERHFPPQSISEIHTADAIVILGGGLSVAGLSRGVADLGDAGDRVLFAARLYWAGAAPVVIATGGAASDRWVSEAEAMRFLLGLWGVPENVVLTEPLSRTTRENAVRVSELLAAEDLHSVILVTSSFHMSRALASFRAVGTEAVPAATDGRSIRNPAWTLLDWLPDVRALELTSAIVWEWLGIHYYRWRGWID